MYRISLAAVPLFAVGFALLGTGPALAQEYVLPPASGVYQTYAPVVPDAVAPVIPYYSYRIAAPVYGPVYEYGPAPYLVPSTVIRQRTFFGPRRVRTIYRAW
jgi:hypothetical protein